ncbi:MAG: transketolase family protein [Leptospiraceae bacterium]|nr:transketolase family protein [Leptospiraceae bacterium]MCP5497371.1 transketolase family protein [Leptospiraceae bacterium]
MESKATRDAYGEALVELGMEREDIVVLDADLSTSTKTGKFAKKFPDRFFNVGVAEQNLIGHAAGLALSGLLPFASSFAMFLTGRAWEITRNSIAYPKLNVKLVSTHGGVTVGEDGASHQCIEDFSIMRTMPNMTVICPSDFDETKQVIRKICDYNGPVYVRLGRPVFPVLNRDADYNFEIGKAEVRNYGKDVCIVACGVMVSEAEMALDILEEKGISATILNMATLKPLDKDTILHFAKECKVMVTCEEHTVVGGLGSAISEFLSEVYPIPILKLGIMDQFGQSGTWQGLLDHYGLRADNIAKYVMKAVTLKTNAYSIST